MTVKKIEEFNKPVGKLGNYVYYFSGGVYRKRLYVKPVQPGTGEQKQYWNKFKLRVKKWQALSIDDKKEWNKKALPYKMSGFNKFMSYWLKIDY